MVDGMTSIWCDASYNEQTKKAGCGIVIKQLLYNGIKETRIQVSEYAADNNCAELIAIKHGLRHVDKPQPRPICIITDSAVALEILRKTIHRVDGNYDDINPKYRKVVADIVHELAGERVRLYHIKGHTKKNDRYHETQVLCDKLAKQSRKDYGNEY
jgi:ribonuclease HI